MNRIEEVIEELNRIKLTLDELMQELHEISEDEKE